MASSTSTNTTVYKTPEDWISWNLEFILRAEGLNLWTYIDPAKPTPWPRQPIPPSIENYEARQEDAESSATATAGRVQTRSGPRTVTPSRHGANLVPISIADLTPESKRTINTIGLPMSSVRRISKIFEQILRN
ncbi:hypothetical protein BKA65DRAFT_206152 [Rhexocercosporidium sp. MPI-PUGE-AT-0058]|nr:hypothetical protein BKA65DRAFT_206152 [Rhexocercosporidium sp. MPI-PUGE-AT-0058]